MEIKAKLFVRTTKKGIAGEISWTDDQGRAKRMPVPPGIPLTLDMNGMDCIMEREGGQIISLVVEGQDLMTKREMAPSQSKSGMRSGQEPPPPGSSPPHLSSFNKGKSDGEIYDVRMAKMPLDTIGVLAQNVQIENFHLQLYKTAPYIVEQTRRKGPKEIGFKVYHKNIVKLAPIFSEKPINALLERQKKSIRALSNHCKVFECSTDWRLIIGLGGASVYETSMTLHHLYGIPYIPGSAIKGVTRSCYIIEKYGQREDPEKEALNDPMFQKIFGHPKLENAEASKGFVVFHDAFPTTSPQIVPDVMNPHYGPYYSDEEGKIPPADYHSPVPVTFLTVQNTTFRFWLSLQDRSGQLQGSSNIEKVLSTAEEWLKKAISKFGIGAKTSVGYGYMNIQS
ncbi:MAG: type III-B CRISPR module RAMP protein Cmr6 [Calditrichaeota bacterium]|nr:MAG: type III-B CRISPR module RAMP protein Cmr6 [Calditrichota bacterium]